MLNLDTHILVAFLQGKLTRDEDRALARQVWGISPIVLWELASLRALGRIRIDLDDRELQHDLRAIPVFPLSLEVAMLCARLDFQSDPADQIIAATSIHYDAPLVTRDSRIRGSRMVPFAL